MAKWDLSKLPEGCKPVSDKQWDALVDPARVALEALIASGDNMTDRIEELEAKLAKAVERLEKLARWLDIDDEELAALPIEELPSDHRHIQKQVETTLAELKGEK